ncbi:response regulator transcription factor [Propionibacteriaceae bacterium Y1685]
MTASRILVIEDAEAIRVAVEATLTAHGFLVFGAPDGRDLDALMDRARPHLVVLDVMLPGPDGFTLLQRIRTISDTAVLMLTARDTTADRVRGLVGGADDHLGKPFAMAELVARVTAVLRRTQSSGPVVEVADLLIEDDALRVSRAGQVIDLTDTERRILHLLASRGGHAVGKPEIISTVWGWGDLDPNVVEVHVSTLRRKIERHGPRLIHTVRGRGYRLAEQP